MPFFILRLMGRMTMSMEPIDFPGVNMGAISREDAGMLRSLIDMAEELLRSSHLIIMLDKEQ